MLSNHNLIESDGSSCNLNSLLEHIPIFLIIISKNNILDNDKLFHFISNNFDILCNKSILSIIINNDNYINNFKIKKKYNIPMMILSDNDMMVADYYGCKIKQNLFGDEYETIKDTVIFVDKGGHIIKRWDHSIISEIENYFTK